LIIRIIFSIIEGLIRNISGGLGQRIRFIYYRRRFRVCGVNVKIDEGVVFYNPENIEIGSDVWFMQYSIITAKPLKLKTKERALIKKNNKDFNKEIGTITFGSEIQIGAFNILQGYGGICIDDKVTTSARVSIYSHSHYPFDKNNRSTVTYANSMVRNSPISCIESPIVIKEGVWIGLNVIIFAGAINKNCFIASNSIVLTDLDENSYAMGSPAVKVKNRFKVE
jgi:acetyltransferase-like isoleucine patch superfamily enzyme